MVRYSEKLIALLFVSFCISIVACKKKNVDAEPVIENGGEIVSADNAKGKLDTGFVTLGYNGEKVNGLVIFLETKKSSTLSSSIVIVYTNIPQDAKTIPEGDFTLQGDDFYHFGINNNEDFGGHQKDLKFSLKRISNNRYSITFSGTTTTGKSLTGYFVNDLATHAY